jgi:2-polyprenyl-6-methoxyphenol hydroxylase-like FAD-dependent oxidoreductase
VAWIVEWVLRARRDGLSLGSRDLAEAYEGSRAKDLARTVGITDTLARGFRPQLPGMGLLRSVALSSLKWLSPVDSWLSRAAMGMQPPVPALATGLTLGELEEDIRHGIC